MSVTYIPKPQPPVQAAIITVISHTAQTDDGRQIAVTESAGAGDYIVDHPDGPVVIGKVEFEANYMPAPAP